MDCALNAEQADYSQYDKKRHENEYLSDNIGGYSELERWDTAFSVFVRYKTRSPNHVVSHLARVIMHRASCELSGCLDT